MIESKIHIGILTLRLFIGSSQSLKDKRMVLRGIKDKIRNNFNVSVSELEGHDKWQTAVLGIAMIGNEHKLVADTLHKIVGLIERYPAVEICEQVIEFV
jgi:uncharacterized protein YlxP (DUF503 family)